MAYLFPENASNGSDPAPQTPPDGRAAKWIILLFLALVAFARLVAGS